MSCAVIRFYNGTCQIGDDNSICNRSKHDTQFFLTLLQPLLCLLALGDVMRYAFYLYRLTSGIVNKMRVDFYNNKCPVFSF